MDFQFPNRITYLFFERKHQFLFFELKNSLIMSYNNYLYSNEMKTSFPKQLTQTTNQFYKNQRKH